MLDDIFGKKKNLDPSLFVGTKKKDTNIDLILGNKKSSSKDILLSKKVPKETDLMSLFMGKSHPAVKDKITRDQRKVLKGPMSDYFGDWDNDGVINALDCAPRNPKKHSNGITDFIKPKTKLDPLREIRNEFNIASAPSLKKIEAKPFHNPNNLGVYNKDFFFSNKPNTKAIVGDYSKPFLDNRMPFSKQPSAKDILGMNYNPSQNLKEFGVLNNPQDILGGRKGSIIGDKITGPQNNFLRESTGMNSFSRFIDHDGDGVISGLDCAPFDNTKHGFLDRTKNLFKGKGFTSDEQVETEEKIKRLKKFQESAQEKIGEKANVLVRTKQKLDVMEQEIPELKKQEEQRFEKVLKDPETKDIELSQEAEKSLREIERLDTKLYETQKRAGDQSQYVTDLVAKAKSYDPKIKEKREEFEDQSIRMKGVKQELAEDRATIAKALQPVKEKAKDLWNKAADYAEKDYKAFEAKADKVEKNIKDYADEQLIKQGFYTIGDKQKVKTNIPIWIVKDDKGQDIEYTSYDAIPKSKKGFATKSTKEIETESPEIKASLFKGPMSRALGYALETKEKRKQYQDKETELAVEKLRFMVSPAKLAELDKFKKMGSITDAEYNKQIQLAAERSRKAKLAEAEAEKRQKITAIAQKQKDILDLKSIQQQSEYMDVQRGLSKINLLKQQEDLKNLQEAQRARSQLDLSPSTSYSQDSGQRMSSLGGYFVSSERPQMQESFAPQRPSYLDVLSENAIIKPKTSPPIQVRRPEPTQETPNIRVKQVSPSTVEAQGVKVRVNGSKFSRFNEWRKNNPEQWAQYLKDRKAKAKKK